MKRGHDKVSPTVRASLELLGVSSGVTQNDLKKAYHKLALLYHPDRNPDKAAAEEFRRITVAYELLSDPLRTAELNRKYMTERLHQQVVDGLNITFGTFFGYRLFKTSDASSALQLEGKGGQKTERVWEPVEENNSILDNSAYDAIEVVYAGKHSGEDEVAVKGEVDGKKLVHLPWVVLNNQGLLKFLDGDIKRSAECYRKLNERIPNNIIFMYRLGLCLIIEGFQKPRTTFLGTKKPDQIKIKKGLALLEHCVKIGESRTAGRQKCLVIKKTIADVREKIGEGRAARKLWSQIAEQDPKSVEAVYKTKGLAAAAKLLDRRSASPNLSGGESTLLLTKAKR